MKTKQLAKLFLLVFLFSVLLNFLPQKTVLAKPADKTVNSKTTIQGEWIWAGSISANSATYTYDGSKPLHWVNQASKGCNGEKDFLTTNVPGYDLLEQKVHIFSTTGTPADTTCIETIYRLNMSLASNASMLFAYKDASTIDFYDNYYVNGYKLSKAASVPGTSKDYILNTSRDCKDYLQVLESKPAVAKLFYLTRDINNDAGNENNGEIGFHNYGNNIFFNV